MRAFTPLVAMGILGAAIALSPMVFGTAVATTLSSELVPLGGSLGRLTLAAAVISAIVVTSVLSRLGLATSLTLALISGIAGAGAGAGLTVSWLHLGGVLAGVAIAPVLGMVAAALSYRAARRNVMGTSVIRRVTGLHIAAFIALCVAFGTNDAQKLLAVVTVAVGSSGGEVAAVWWQLVPIAVLFAAGAAIGIRRMARPTTAGLLAVKPFDAAVSELSTAGVMFAGSLLGTPAGMAQTLSGSFIGVGLTRGKGRVRWDYAARIVNAWVVTMPASVALAWLLGRAAAVLVDFVR